jgi:hypothetical protein
VRAITVIRWSLLAAAMMFCMAAPSFAQVSVSVTIAPPELPVYDQPICPGDDYIWTPGYWAWGDDDYFWVPGTWVLAPEPGLYWTPPYWGWSGASYVFYDGFWGPQIGFYGGIDYGFGYFGHGYEGGHWDNGHFFYNRSVTNVNIEINHNVYNAPVTHNEQSHASFNGPRGVDARPDSREEAAAHDRHIPPVPDQAQHMQEARGNQQLRASVNHGRPPIAATSRPGAFNDRGIAPAREGGAVSGRGAMPENNANNAARSNEAGSRPVHVKDLPAADRPAAPNTGNPKLDQKYQQQQQQLYSKQDQERQKLQQRQDQDHAKLAQQHASDAKTQQLEQRHQQQTQQLQQRHTQQVQTMQQRQQPGSKGR